MPSFSPPVRAQNFISPFLSSHLFLFPSRLIHGNPSIFHSCHLISSLVLSFYSIVSSWTPPLLTWELWANGLPYWSLSFIFHIRCYLFHSCHLICSLVLSSYSIVYSGTSHCWCENCERLDYAIIYCSLSSILSIRCDPQTSQYSLRLLLIPKVWYETNEYFA